MKSKLEKTNKKQMKSIEKTSASVNEAIDPSPLVDLTLLQTILAGSALITAALIYVGWLYHRRYLGIFGILPELMNYGTQDYILRARYPLAAGFLVAIPLLISAYIVNFSKKTARVLLLLLSLLFALSIVLFKIIQATFDSIVLRPIFFQYDLSWRAILVFGILLLYSALSASYIFIGALKRGVGTKKLSLFVWSGYVSLAFISISTFATYLGYYDAKIDSSPQSSLMPIRLATYDLLGFDLQPTSTFKDENQHHVYYYDDLRYLSLNNDYLYVFRPRYGFQAPNTYIISMNKVYSLSFGWFHDAQLNLLPTAITTPTAP